MLRDVFEKHNPRSLPLTFPFWSSGIWQMYPSIPSVIYFGGDFWLCKGSSLEFDSFWWKYEIREE